jgi:hypothetical protein
MGSLSLMVLLIFYQNGKELDAIQYVDDKVDLREWGSSYRG